MIDSDNQRLRRRLWRRSAFTTLRLIGHTVHKLKYSGKRNMPCAAADNRKQQREHCTHTKAVELDVGILY
jgi:L-ribulose-5-phosphate 3-epimerase UlaE